MDGLLHVKGESVGFSSQGAVYAISRLGRRKFLLFTTILEAPAAVQESKRTLRAMAGASVRMAASNVCAMQQIWICHHEP